MLDDVGKNTIFIKRFTDDGTWIYELNVETVQQSGERRQNEPKPKQKKRTFAESIEGHPSRGSDLFSRK